MSDRELYELFHSLWTKAVGLEGYCKEQWIQLEQALEKRGMRKVRDLAPPNRNPTKIVDEPRQFTQKEMQDAFLAHLWMMTDYWATVQQPKTVRDRLEGLAFSILAMLDGTSMDLPAFSVYPDPHPEDKAFHQDQGSNWWPEESDEIGLHGGDCPQLHECWHTFGREKGYTK